MRASASTSLSGVGEQSRAVEGGLPADVVEFSLEPDMTRLVDADLVDPGWSENEYKGMVTNSVVVFMVRKGNPKGIKGLGRPRDRRGRGPRAQPVHLGRRKWNIMAAYGAQLEKGKSPEQAKQYLADLFKNVPVLDKSARESLQTFSSGKGDVLLGYENEAILAKQKGEEPRLHRPGSDAPDREPGGGVNESDDPELAQSFVDFLYTAEERRRSSWEGLPARGQGRTAGADKFPEPPTCSRSRSSAAGTR